MKYVYVLLLLLLLILLALFFLLFFNSDQLRLAACLPGLATLAAFLGPLSRVCLRLFLVAAGAA